MNGFERRTESKKRDILRAALELIAKQGFKAAKIAEIAEKAHVSPISIYNYFGSKKELARQAYFMLINEAMGEAEKLLAGDLPFEEKYQKLVAVKFEMESSLSPDYYQSTMWNDPAIQKFHQEYGETRTIPLIMNLIEQGKREGFVDRELSAEAIILYSGIFREALMNRLSKKVRQDLVSLFFYGLLGKTNPRA